MQAIARDLLMVISPAWARGLPLDVDGYECSFYLKD